MNNRFSVVITSNNRRDYLLQAIESVASQTHAAQEIIVVIDGSTDDSARSVRAIFPAVQLIEQPNLGPSVARNTGLAACNSEWVCFLDDDDIWHRDKLLRTAEYISQHPECRAIRNPVWFFTDSEDGPRQAFGFSRDFVAADVVECHQAVEGGDFSKNNYSYLLIEGNSHKLLLECNRGVMSSSVIHRETLIRAGGFCPMQKYGEDWTMFANVARLTEWHTLPVRLGFTRLHVQQSTNDVSNGLYTLVGLCNAWLTGWPFARRANLDETLIELAKYGSIYRQAVQLYFWTAVRNRNWRVARLILATGVQLLPRLSDRIYVYIPPPITWRWERYILRMHKSRCN